jgi:SAM-dependent methyltransferase
MELNELLALVPDKSKDRTTTSHRFKTDLYNFFKKPEFENKTCLEIGCKNGYTTIFLTCIFKLVYGINYDTVVSPDNFLKSHGRSNYELFAQDVYKLGLPVKSADVIFVDAVHTYDAVIMDVSNSLKLTSSGKKYFVFDDIGLYPEVKSAVDVLIGNNILKMETKIGYSPFETGFVGFLDDYEGVICSEV